LKQFVADLDDFRTQSFGQPGAERVIRMAAWEELMPTDGTYVESIVGGSESADENLDADMEAQRQLIEAQAAALSGAGHSGGGGS
jgi:hypothetical protein